VNELSVDIPKLQDAVKKIESKNPIKMAEGAKEIMDIQKDIMTPSSDC